MHTAYLLLGSNMGNKKALLQEARSLLQEKAGKIIGQSSLYESEPWGFEAHEWFINQVIIIETPLRPNELLFAAQTIEERLGRVRAQTEGYVSRPIDIDILFYNNEIIESPALTVPHPLLQNRRFTLLPLAEIVPEYKHPVLNKTIEKLLAECSDTGNVHAWTV